MQQSIIAHVSQVKTDLGTAQTTHINNMSDHLKEIWLFISNLPHLRFTQPSSGSAVSRPHHLALTSRPHLLANT
eukprot:2587355-Ditylum_brightwellii.AAC.1